MIFDNLPHIKNSKILVGVGFDMIYFLHDLTDRKKILHKDNDFAFYFLEKENCYLCLYSIGNTFELLKEGLITYLDHYVSNNKIHLLLSCENEPEMSNFLVILNDRYELTNLRYSLGLTAGEIFEPSYFLNISMKLFKGVITSSPAKVITELTKLGLIDNLIDHKYSFLYFYNFAGYYLGVNDKSIQINNKRLPKIFYYSKSNEYKEFYINELVTNISSELLYPKEYTEEIRTLSDLSNYNKVTHFVTSWFDYSICMFNVTFETGINYEFMTEKTLKAVISNTPTFLVINDKVYKTLKEAGFYFLNDEFDGETINDKFINFVNYIKDCDEASFKKLYKKTSIKAKYNRGILIDYVYSHKHKELDYLLNI
jgi:hypothetical protein